MVESKVTVAKLLLKVPLLVIFLAIVNNADGGAVNVPLAAIDNEPFISITGLLVLAVTITAFVPFPIVKSLLIVIVWLAALPSVKVGAEAAVGTKVRL